MIHPINNALPTGHTADHYYRYHYCVPFFSRRSSNVLFRIMMRSAVADQAQIFRTLSRLRFPALRMRL